MKNSHLNKKQLQQIKSALHNTLEKVKAHIRRTGEIPDTETAFEWFQQISEIDIIKDKPSLSSTKATSKQFEAIFFFNNLQVHLFLEFEESEFRGHPYFNAPFHFTIINHLDPNDDMDEQELNYLKEKFNITLS